MPKIVKLTPEGDAYRDRLISKGYTEERLDDIVAAKVDRVQGRAFEKVFELEPATRGVVHAESEDGIEYIASAISTIETDDAIVHHFSLPADDYLNVRMNYQDVESLQEEEFDQRVLDLLGKPEEFVIDSDEKVEWALWKLRQIDSEAEGFQSAIDAYRKLIADLEERKARRTHAAERFKDRFEGQIAAHVLSMNKVEKIKGQTRIYKNGPISVRSISDRFVVSDPEKAQEYAESFYPELVKEKVVKTLDKQGYAKLAMQTAGLVPDDNGEAVMKTDVPGVEYKPRGSTFSFKKEKTDADS